MTQNDLAQTFTAAQVLAALGASGNTLQIVNVALSDSFGHVLSLNSPTLGLTVSRAADGSLVSFSLDPSAFRVLAAGENVTLVTTFDVSDGKVFTASSASLTIEGLNDPTLVVADFNSGDAVVEAGVNPGNTPFAGDSSAAGNVLANDSDIDASDVLTVSGVAAGVVTGPLNGGVGVAVTGTYGSLILGADGNWTYTLDNSDTDTKALAQAEGARDVFSHTVSDGHGGLVATTLTINVAGTNDEPVILQVAQGQKQGAVQEDGTSNATGKLTAVDPDHGATQTWTVLNGAGTVAGTNPHAANYSFALDKLTIVRAGSSIVVDDFASAPANGGGIYSVGVSNIPGTLVTGTDGNGRSVVLLDAAHGIVTPGIGSTDALHRQRCEFG